MVDRDLPDDRKLPKETQSQIARAALTVAFNHRRQDNTRIEQYYSSPYGRHRAPQAAAPAP